MIQVLIGDEPESGLQDLKQVQIPEHIKFDDEQLLNTASDEQWKYSLSQIDLKVYYSS